MIRIQSRSASVAAALALLLGACSKAAPQHAAAAASDNGFLAIARGKVDVEGGILHIVAPRDGLVAQAPGAIGDRVKAGDILLTLDSAQAKISVDMAKAELAQSEAQRMLLRAKVPGMQQRVARVGEASKAGAASGQAADDATQALAELNAEIAVADASVESDRQKIRQAEYEVQARVVRAPLAGTIVARNVHPGDMVSAQGGVSLIDLLPDGPHIVRAELNEGFVAKVKVGMSAQVNSEVDSTRSFSARVIRIGEVFGPSKFAEEGQDPIDARDVECILDLPESDLRVGQRVQVRFLGAESAAPAKAPSDIAKPH